MKKSDEKSKTSQNFKIENLIKSDKKFKSSFSIESILGKNKEVMDFGKRLTSLLADRTREVWNSV